MTPDGLTDDIPFPFDRDDSPTRLLVWEKSGRWAASLRRELGEATTRPIEIRSSRMLKDELGERPYSFVLIEAREDNAHRVLDALVHLGDHYPQAMLAVACEQVAPQYHDRFREAGAMDVILSVKDTPRIARVYLRFIEHVKKRGTGNDRLTQ